MHFCESDQSWLKNNGQYPMCDVPIPTPGSDAPEVYARSLDGKSGEGMAVVLASLNRDRTQDGERGVESSHDQRANVTP